MDCELLKTPEFGKDEGPPPTTKFGVLENKQVEGVVDNVKQYYNFNPEELGQVNKQIDKIKKVGDL